MVVSKKIMEINPQHSIMIELKKEATADKSDKIVKDFDLVAVPHLLAHSGFNLDEPTRFAGRSACSSTTILRAWVMMMTCCLEEVEGAADETYF